MRSWTILAFSFALGMHLFAQEAPAPKPTYPILGLHLGVGAGQDAGGLIGARLTYWAVPYASVFIGGGWAFIGGGYNAGVELRAPTRGTTSPFVVGMYGYNGVIRIKGKEQLNGMYYGPTFGAGLMVRQRATRNYWRFSINVPLRSQEMLDDWDAIKARPDIEVQNDLIPITVGIGFHLCLSNPRP